MVPLPWHKRFHCFSNGRMKIVSAALLSLVATVSADPSLCLDGVNVGYSDVTTLAADLINPLVHAANGK